MSGSRTFIQLISIAVLLLWAGVMLFFYYSGRLGHYLPQDGVFQPLVLVAGIGLVVLALFNLLTANSEAAGCAHDGCCGHDHAKGAGHDHDHDHDHGHDHSHEHHHTHAEAMVEPLAPHGHGILEESSWTGRLIALLILAAPLTWAALQTPDRYSANAMTNKGMYTQDYGSTAKSDKFSLRTDAAAGKPDVAKKSQRPAPKPTPSVADAPPGPGTPVTPGVVTTEAIAKTPATPAGAASTQSYGKFSLADLEAQVPKSKEGNFILEVPEIYYTAGDAEVQGVIAGQSVETTAQVLPEKVNNPDGHRLRIFRLLVQCCAADARPYSVPVDFGKKAPEFKDMTWVKVVGKMSFRKEGNQTVPVIEGTSIEPTEAPENAMISQ